MESIMIILLPLFMIISRFMLEFCLLIISISFITITIKNKNYKIFNNYFVIFFLSFYFLLLLSFSFSLEKSNILSILVYFRFGLYVMAVYFFLIEEKNTIKYFLNSIGIIILLLFFDSLFQYFFGQNLIGLKVYENHRITSFFVFVQGKGGDIVRTLPDATFGLNLSGNNWYIGAAIPQLLSSELNLMDDNFARIYDTTSQNGKLASHIYVLGSYTYDVNTIISIEPSFFLKSVAGIKTQIDFGVKSEYKKIIWAGINYKMNNDLSSIAALLGYNINDRFNIGYSCGMPSSANSNYYSGSHEFMLGVKFPN